MPGFMATMAQRVSDARDEWNERMEDGMTGRRNKYGLKTNLWYEEEERRQRREERHRRHRHHRDRSRGHSRRSGTEEANGDDYMMSGAGGDPVEGHERELPEEGETDHAAAEKEHTSRRSQSHRSQALSESPHPSSHHSNSGSIRGRNDPERQGRRHRTRGEEELTIVEILERTDVLGRELPQEDGATKVYGPPPIYGPQHMYAPPGVYGPQPRKRGTKDLSRRQEPSGKPARHPKMRSYDDGGLMSLVKAIGINLVEEQLRKKNESENPQGRNEKRPKQPKPRSRDEERRGRSRTSRSIRSPSPLSYRGKGSGSRHPETPRPGTPGGSDRHHEPPMDPAIEAEYRQAEEMEAERAQEAREMEEGHVASSHHSEEQNSAHEENPFHDGHEAAGPMDSPISSMPPSSVSEPEGHPPGHASAAAAANNPPGSRHSGRPPSVAGSTHRHPDTVSPIPRVPEQTDSEGSDGVHSGDESDHSEASTRATVPSSNPSSNPQLSGSPNTTVGGGRSGRRAGRGGRTQATRPRGGGHDDDLEDDLEDESYNLRESYDDEYEGPGRSRWDPNARPTFTTSNANQGRHNSRHQQKQPQLMQLPHSDFWVALEHYEFYLNNPPPRMYAPRPSTQHQARHDHHKSERQGRNGDSNTAPKGKKNSSKKTETEKQKKSRSRYEEYEAGSDGPSRRHAGRATTSPTRSGRPSTHKEKPKSNHKAKPSKSTRRHDPKEDSSSFSFDDDDDSDSDSPPSIHRSDNGREKPTHIPNPKDHPPSQRSPRPYNRTGSRATPKSKKTPKTKTHTGYSSSSYSSLSDPSSSSSSESDNPYSSSTRHHSTHPSPPPTPRTIPERPKDYYAVLGLKPGATAAEIKLASRSSRFKAHTDRIPGFASMSPEEQKPFTERAAEVGEAADLLGDEVQRGRYDGEVEEWGRRWGGGGRRRR
ncbi:MAG: hypothetical protein HETSPECPRED_006382 [Heterodermia speciosa]|uniref:J domain-containing protein n=1 Tax=Heterodermia speciosa TaxID=116794 RepID=A0A8H3FIM5_9LECA|nr:MAG: hypothetical protein HETSPECPRED_006382 [Heterodermia speciosa]